MYLLLRICLYSTLLYCCWNMMVYARGGDRRRLEGAGRWLRAGTVLSAVLALVWLLRLLRP
jgi:hypothetical protein